MKDVRLKFNISCTFHFTPNSRISARHNMCMLFPAEVSISTMLGENPYQSLNLPQESLQPFLTASKRLITSQKIITNFLTKLKDR